MNFELIRHGDLNSRQLKGIAKLKSEHWKHTVDSQIAWINSTYQDDDVHLLLKDNDQLIGYVTIANVLAFADEKPIALLGISCLCVDKQYLKHGYGALILNYASKWAEDNNKIICLLCREKLVKWYEKNRYIVLQPHSITVAKEPFEHFLMFYNNGIYENTLYLHEATTIDIDKNF